jgi:preprotein translocase subunit YajC
LLLKALPALALLQEGAAEAPPRGGLTNLLFPMVAIFGIFFFLVILPERKKQRKREDMLKTLEKGDKVVTTGGLHGTVSQAADDVVVLQVADGVRLRFNRSAIHTVLRDEAGAASSAEPRVESRKD